MSLRAFPTKRGQWWLAILAESEVFIGFGAARESCSNAFGDSKASQKNAGVYQDRIPSGVHVLISDKLRAKGKEVGIYRAWGGGDMSDPS